MSGIETGFAIDDLLKNMTSACTSTAANLRESTENEDLRYVIPRMSVSLKLEMSYSDGKVKGVFFKRRSSSKETTALSEISLDIVAVPVGEG